MKVAALIMAGGRGERFWPRSRTSLPKQFLSLTKDGKTMLQKTVERILPLADIEDVFVATNENYKSIVSDELPGLPEENILLEPVGRNTAPCIGLGAVHIQHKYGDAVMLVLPADSLINNTDVFTDTISRSVKVAEEKDSIITMGIAPSYPETGYGYIKYIPNSEINGTYAVDFFAEKPCLQKAKEYVESGLYLWNGGTFIFKTSVILEKLALFNAEIYSSLQKIKKSIGLSEYRKVLEEEFFKMPSISIDYAVMEKADNIRTAKALYDWDDVGSWLALERTLGKDADGNTFRGDVMSLDSKNTIVQGGKRLISLIGAEDLVVVDTDDALLICRKDKTSDIKRLLDIMKKNNRKEI